MSRGCMACKVLIFMAAQAIAFSHAFGQTPGSAPASAMKHVGIVLNGLVLDLDAARANGSFAPYAAGCTGGELSWYDISPTGSTGTLTSFSSCSSTVGWNGTGIPSSPYRLTFDGGGDYVELGNLGSVPTAGSIEFWTRPSAIVSYNNVMCTMGLGGQNGGFRFEENSAGNLGVVVGNNSGTYTGHGYTNSLTAGTWYHVVLAWDSSQSKVWGYFNDSLVFSDAQTYWSTTYTDVKVGVGFSATRYWQGDIAKVALYSHALSQSEVRQNCFALVARFAGAVCN